MDGDEITSFASIRVAGIVEKTQEVLMNQNPNWNTKFGIPVYMPVLNEKIIIRIWDKKKLGDRLIASIPELPTFGDEFNISHLICHGGAMPAKWINLYGHPLNEKTTGKNLKTKLGLAKKTYSGSAWLGRVLI